MMLTLPQLCFRLQCRPVTILSHVRLSCVAMQSKMAEQPRGPPMWNTNRYVNTRSSVAKLCSQPLTSNTAHPASARWKSMSAKHQTGLGDMDSKEFVELYFIKNISFLRVLCRFSKLSVLMFLFAAPASFMSTQLGVISAASGTKVALTFAAYSVLFTVQSFLFSSRIVGKIMMSSDEKVVKLSHLSMFGDRRDVFFKPSDILPQRKDTGGGYLAENLQSVRIKGYSKRLYYMPHQGHVDTDHERVDLLLSGEFTKTRGV